MNVMRISEQLRRSLSTESRRQADYYRTRAGFQSLAAEWQRLSDAAWTCSAMEIHSDDRLSAAAKKTEATS